MNKYNAIVYETDGYEFNSESIIINQVTKGRIIFPKIQGE